VLIGNHIIISRRLAQQRTTCSDLEWPFHIIRIVRYFCSFLLAFDVMH